MKTILSIFIKLKLISFRKIILIMVEKMLKIGSHLHSLKADFKKELALCNGGDQTKIHYVQCPDFRSHFALHFFLDKRFILQ